MKEFLKYFFVLIIGMGLGLQGFAEFSKTELYKNLTRGETPIQKAVPTTIPKEITQGELAILRKALPHIKRLTQNPNEIIQEALPIVYVNDSDVGPMLKPNTKIHYKTPYFETTITTNAEGFTGRNYRLDTDHYRIAILGDSAVEAYGVADTNRFPHMTELRVYQKTGGKQKVEVMGFGVSGWGTVHHYGALRKYVLKYKPDEIWLMFMPTNDLGDNTPFLNAPPLGPTLIYKNPDSDEIIDIKFGYTAIPQVVQDERIRRYGKERLRDTLGKWTYGLLPYYWSSEQDPHWDLIMDQTYQTLGLIKKLCKKNNIKVSLIYRNTNYELNQKIFDQFKMKAQVFLKKNLPMERNLGIERFRKRVEDMGIDFINSQEMEKPGITTKADESEVTKHFNMANFFSDIIIKKLNVKNS